MAKSGKYKCSKCDRSFSMAGHLGRHMATIHAGSPKAAPAGQGRPKSAPAGAGLPAGLLSSVQAWHAELAAQQTQIATQMAALDQLMATLGGTARSPGGRPTRGGAPAASGGHGGSLRSVIHQVLRQAGKPMRVVEITDAVLKAGYQTRNKTLAKSVGITLAEMADVKKVDRGIFAAK